MLSGACRGEGSSTPKVWPFFLCCLVLGRIIIVDRLLTKSFLEYFSGFQRNCVAYSDIADTKRTSLSRRMDFIL